MTAFRATYSDWKLVKTRGVVQLVFEVPLHEADIAYQIVGGMPDIAAERWFGIARLKPETEVMPDDDSKPTVATQPDPVSESDRAHSWHEMKPAQQAGILCNDKSFQTFIKEREPNNWRLLNTGTNTERTAEIVRAFCGVQSRGDIGMSSPSGILWKGLVSDYRAWIREPEVVG